MIGVIVFYRAYQLPKRVAPDPASLESYNGPSYLISPRLVNGPQGNPRIILDLDSRVDFCAWHGEALGLDHPDFSEQQEKGFSSLSVDGVKTAPKTDTKIRLKSVCCEKYKKGNRCKRCPCFDLQ